MIEVIMIFSGGLLIGGLLGYYFGIRLKKPDGVIIVDDSNETTTKWDLKVNSVVEEIPKKKRIIFSVQVIK